MYLYVGVSLFGRKIIKIILNFLRIFLSHIDDDSKYISLMTFFIINNFCSGVADDMRFYLFHHNFLSHTHTFVGYVFIITMKMLFVTKLNFYDK